MSSGIDNSFRDSFSSRSSFNQTIEPVWEYPSSHRGKRTAILALKTLSDDSSISSDSDSDDDSDCTPVLKRPHTFSAAINPVDTYKPTFMGFSQKAAALFLRIDNTPEAFAGVVEQAKTIVKSYYSPTTLSVPHSRTNGEILNWAYKTLRVTYEIGYPDTSFYLGVCYWNGYGTPVDKVAGEYWVRIAANMGDKDAVMFIQNKIVKAPIFTSSAEFVPAPIEEVQLEPIPTFPSRHSLALLPPEELYQIAGKIKYALEQRKLLDKKSEPYKQLFKIYQTAAATGYIPALYGLGTCYFFGLGVDEDKVRGHRMLSEALKNPWTV